MTYRRKVDINPFNSITSILFLVFAFVALYWLATGIFKILTVAAPFLLVAALLIDYRVVVNYGKWLWNLLRKNPLMGIGGILLTFFGFPIISGFLLGKALLYRKVNKIKEEFDTKQNGEFAEFEELDDEPQIRMELPEIKKPQKRKDDDYDQFFD
ncbi:MAG: hypothetical protein ACI8P3_002336 [Saprospiraceae bacterium]|jgi:hypothetical protein